VDADSKDYHALPTNFNSDFFFTQTGNSDGSRRRLPTLPPSRTSPRSSVSGVSTTQQPREECGWIQLGLSFEAANLIVTLWAAEGLKMIENAESMALPKPYAMVRLCMFG
jgi:hypothetical protein